MTLSIFITTFSVPSITVLVSYCLITTKGSFHFSQTFIDHLIDDQAGLTSRITKIGRYFLLSKHPSTKKHIWKEFQYEHWGLAPTKNRNLSHFYFSKQACILLFKFIFLSYKFLLINIPLYFSLCQAF